MYAADKTGNDAMYPKDLKHRADINRWLLWEASSWFPTCYIYLVEYVVKPLLKGTPDEKVIEAESEKCHRGLGILEARLSKSKWLTGDRVTIADIAVAAPMHLHSDQKLPLEQYPNVKRWLVDGVEQLDSWKKTQGAVDKALRPSGVRTPASVQTMVNYTKVVDRVTELYFYESDKAKDVHAPGDAPVEITVSDGWPKAHEFTIDKNGFSVHDFDSKHDNWVDDEVVRSGFYPDVVEFLKATTGAKRVLVFDHTIRSERNAQKKLTDEKNTSQRTPVMLVHCDYTNESGPVRVTQLLGAEAEDLLSRRYAFINVWKPLNIVEERPLAMCDVQSCHDDDFFKLFLRYRDRVGENYVMSHSPRHKWWYFPRMTPDKAILLKTFDSATDGRARFVGHTAFEDPTSKSNAPMRESVEIRTICFY
ncbi:glutathione S-transferase [Paraphoma chrysanthemicola]|uniref:Glutathione S-transferase n=1 Tax=Paraphoma chrysanthemicola TaxID=798071 RepID=A0A8K0RA96_9PLEO|nr:glutathione S-transferase [Paraphoma chrysanthemicola]